MPTIDALADTWRWWAAMGALLAVWPVGKWVWTFDPHNTPYFSDTVRWILGLGLLMASSKLLVWGAVGIASALGVSDLIIGLTILAVGTSLPELASSIIAARKNEHDIALGNVIGSNMFNTLAVVGIAGAIQQATVPDELLTRDMPVMLLLTCGLVLLAIRGRKRREISRGEGVLLLGAFASYTGWLVLSL